MTFVTWTWYGTGQYHYLNRAVLHISSLLLLVAETTAAAQMPRPSPPASTPSQDLKVGAADVLQAALDENLYFVLPFALEHASGLTKEQTDFFQGMLAFREGRFEDARKSLIAALNANPTVLTSVQKIEAFEILAHNARFAHLYGACTQMNDDIVKIWGDRLGAAEQDIKEERHFCAAQQHTPVQTISFTNPFTIKRQGGEYPIRIRKASGYAEFDTGASESVITESVAKAWGITPGDASVVLHGYSGGAFNGHPAVIPELTIGTAVLHDVAVIVVPDADFYLAPAKLQLHALLGMPVLLALGRLTFAQGGSVTVSPTSAPGSSTEGAPLWLGDSQLLVQLRTLDATGRSFHFQNGNELRLFVLDTGSRDSYFTDHYLNEHHESFAGAPSTTAKLTGAGGEIDTAAYVGDHLPLWCGSSMLSVSGPHVLTAAQPGFIENFEGLLGQDVLGTLKSYTIDLRTMRFRVEP